jgi:cytoskeletal protein CcmA (bactofilin family)
MLKKKGNSSPNGFDTLIGKNASFEGTFKTTGLLRIDGKFDGNIEVSGDIIVGKDGRINGNIKSNNVEISGIVEANVVCEEQLKISSSGKLYGDIEVGSFVVEEKGVFDGKCKMKNETNPETESKKSSKIKAV